MSGAKPFLPTVILSPALQVLLAVCVLAISFLSDFGDAKKLPIHGDEGQWIATTIYWDALFEPELPVPSWIKFFDETWRPSDGQEVALNPSGAQGSWDNTVEESKNREPFKTRSIWSTGYWTLTHPPINRYFFGAILDIFADPNAPKAAPYDYGLSRQANHDIGTLPRLYVGSQLWVCRAANSLVACIIGTLIFTFLTGASGLLSAWVWIAFFISTPLVRETLQRAFADSLLLLLVCIATGVLIWVFKIHSHGTESSSKREGDSSSTRLFVVSILAGITSGLAAATKLNGLVLAMFGLLALPFFYIRLYRRRLVWRRGLASFGSSVAYTAAAIVTFFGVNPFLYNNTIERIIQMYLLRQMELHSPEALSRWGVPAGWPGAVVRFNRIFNETSGPFVTFIVVCLFLLGTIALVSKVTAWTRGESNRPEGVVLFLLCILVVVPAVFSPLNWARYFLFPIIFKMVMVAMGAHSVLEYLVIRLQFPPSKR